MIHNIPITVSSHAKAILMGEHAVVYGYPAIAAPLPSIGLFLTYDPSLLAETWETAWSMEGEDLMSESIRVSLTRAFQKALELCQGSLSLFKPVSLRIKSQIPLGGGLGGSAALSVCFIRLASRLTGYKVYDEGQLANELDSFFHSGKASGLDTAAVSSQNFIYFRRNKPALPIKIKKSFWFVLIDSGERAQTADMVNQIALLKQKSPEFVEEHFMALGDFTEKARIALEKGHLKKLGGYLNQAHFHLSQLNLSTIKVDSIVNQLRELKALGVKLTGGGGGGLVLSLFSKKPSKNVLKALKEFKIFVVELLPSKD